MGRALITGGTAGIGLEFAWQLAKEGRPLILVARDKERLTEVAAHIGASTGVDVEILVADLADREDLRKVQRRVIDPVDQVDFLVNNAGYGLAKDFLNTELVAHEKHLDVLVRTVLVLTYDAARVMTARGNGTIINVSSIASLTTMGTYAAAKSWVTVFTEALAEQLRGTGVNITALLPGYVRTEFHERARINAKKIPHVAWLQTKEVVTQCLADARRGVILSVPSRKYQLVAGAADVLPRAMIRRISAGLSRSRHKHALPEEAPAAGRGRKKSGAGRGGASSSAPVVPEAPVTDVAPDVSPAKRLETTITGSVATVKGQLNAFSNFVASKTAEPPEDSAK